MKKILSLILALMLLLLCLASCVSSKHEHITGDWKYNEYGHWQPITCSLNTCHIEEAPLLEHVDDNDDNICDTCSYVILNSQTTNDTPVCSRINLCYHGNKDTSITIEDAGICSKLMTLITKAGGTQGESSKGYYGVPYTLTIYFEGNEAPLVFCLWSDSQYSTSEQRDAEGYQYFFNDDLSDLYQYLEEKYPDEFWYSNNSQSGDSNTECVHTYGEWQYDETYHWCDWSCSLDLCDIDTTGEHIDKDENGICDKCGYFPPINSDVTGFNLQKIVFASLESINRTPNNDSDVINGINETIKANSNAYDVIEFCFFYDGNVSEELFENMHHTDIVQANDPTRMIVRVKYNNINIEALKTLSQVSQITSIHISTVSELGVEPEPDVPLDSNNSQSDYVNAVVLKDGFTFNESWLDSNNELTESKTFVIESQEALDEIFTDFKEIDFDKEMVIVYCYTTIYVREQKLEKVSFDNNILSIEFDVIDGKPGTGDATAPQTRTCVICLDKVAATEVKVTYNGQ